MLPHLNSKWSDFSNWDNWDCAVNASFRVKQKMKKGIANLWEINISELTKNNCCIALHALTNSCPFTFLTLVRFSINFIFIFTLKLDEENHEYNDVLRSLLLKMLGVELSTVYRSKIFNRRLNWNHLINGYNYAKRILIDSWTHSSIIAEFSCFCFYFDPNTRIFN